MIGGDERLKGDTEKDKGKPISCRKPDCPSPDSYDIAALTKLLVTLKKDWPEEQNVILVPESEVPYEVLIMAMDASRQDPDVSGEAGALFPYVVIAGGVQ